MVLGKIFFHYKPMSDTCIDTWAWSICTPGAWLARLMKGTTKHCYIQNIIALGHVVSEKILTLCFSHCKSMGAICCHGNHNFETICSITYCSQSPYPVLVHIKFDHDRPTSFRNICLWNCWRTDADRCLMPAFTKLWLWWANKSSSSNTVWDILHNKFSKFAFKGT